MVSKLLSWRQPVYCGSWNAFQSQGLTCDPAWPGTWVPTSLFLCPFWFATGLFLQDKLELLS